jgi:hypothetical protein
LGQTALAVCGPFGSRGNWVNRSDFLSLFLSNDQTEASMRRTITYRGFEIQVELSPSTDDTFDVTFQIQGGTNLEVLGARGGRIPLRNGPFTERWAYLVAEIAGQAAIDVLLGPVD